MKKLIVILMIFILILSLTACSAGGSVTTTGAEAQNTVSTSGQGGGAITNTSPSTGTVVTSNAVSVADVFAENSATHEDAADYAWDSSAVVPITLNGYSISVGGNGVIVVGTTATITAAGTHYTANGTLEGFFNYYMQVNASEPPPSGPTNPGKPPETRSMRGLHGLVDTQYRALIPTFGYDVGQAVPADMIKQPIPVEVDGQTIAWILPDTSFQFKLGAEEQLFLQRSTLAIGLAALAGVLAAVIIGFWLSGRLVKPIRRLTKASQALAHGDLQQQVPVTSQDELGQLTSTFNQMSADLAQADQQRKRMTADITHDLSTPLQVISGYIEMVEEDGVELTPQRIDIIKTEIEHLRRLVSDMSTLTQVEAGALDIQLQSVPPSRLLERVYHAYQPIAAHRDVKLVLDMLETTPPILVDEGRMIQVLSNLVDNALRYTPKDGCITLSAVAGDQIQLKVKDSGSGISPEDLPYVFDRFYRADKARGGNSGKMGLGLAICKALVTAQGGGISAESEGDGMGTTMIITFNPA